MPKITEKVFHMSRDLKIYVKFFPENFTPEYRIKM